VRVLLNPSHWLFSRREIVLERSIGVSGLVSISPLDFYVSWFARDFQDKLAWYGGRFAAPFSISWRYHWRKISLLAEIENRGESREGELKFTTVYVPVLVLYISLDVANACSSASTAIAVGLRDTGELLFWGHQKRWRYVSHILMRIF
jgi:hypothetical protein